MLRDQSSAAKPATGSAPGTAGFALAADCEHDDEVRLADVAVEGDGAGRAPPVDELAQAGAHGSAHQRAGGQQVEGGHDALDPHRTMGGLMGDAVIEDAPEVGFDSGRQDP